MSMSTEREAGPTPPVAVARELAGLHKISSLLLRIATQQEAVSTTIQELAEALGSITELLHEKLANHEAAWEEMADDLLKHPGQLTKPEDAEHLCNCSICREDDPEAGPTRSSIR